MGEVEEAKRCIEVDGADVGARQTRTGSTALHAAAASGHVGMARMLLRHGAPLDAREEDAVGGWTPLLMACKRGHLEVAVLLVEVGADVHATEHGSGFTALHFCALEGHNTLALALVERGADVHRGDKFGMNASVYAQRTNNRAFLDLPGIPPPLAPTIAEVVTKQHLKRQELAALRRTTVAMPAKSKKKPTKKKR